MKGFFGKRGTGLMIGLGAVLIAVGVFTLAKVSVDYPAQIQQNYDTQLESLVNVVDYNISNIVSNMEADLPYVITRREFLGAERIWRRTGETNGIKQVLQESDVAKSETTSDILMMTAGNKILFSTSGYTDYMLLGDYGGDFQYCTSRDGLVYIMTVAENSRGDARYCVLTLVNVLFSHLSDKLDENTHLTLIDADGHLIIHNHGSRICVHYRGSNISIRYFRNSAVGFCDAAGLEYALKAQDEQERTVTTYRYEGRDAGDSYDCRMLMIPSGELVNGSFSVGASMNMDELLQQMRRTTARNTASTLLVTGGAFLLMMALITYGQSNRKNKEELEILKQKNLAADQLLEKNMELAHHQRLETIGRLTAGVAHEFNNLLTPIMSYSIMSLSKIPPEDTELTEDIVAIYESSRKAEEIVSRLCMLSRRSNSGDSTPISPDQTAARVISVTRPSQPAGVNVELELHAAEAVLFCSEVLLTQILTNLVINAFAAMEQEGGRLVLSTCVTEGNVIFRVQDNGPGIREEVLPHIFEPFFTTKGPGKGTGLGLAIVAQAVDSCYGTIRVESRLGEGASFIVSIPGEIRQDGGEEEGFPRNDFMNEPFCQK